jgi:hypothetical protein
MASMFGMSSPGRGGRMVARKASPNRQTFSRMARSRPSLPRTWDQEDGACDVRLARLLEASEARMVGGE